MKHATHLKRVLLLSTLSSVTACSPSGQDQEPARDTSGSEREHAAGKGEWLRGGVDQRFALVAKHLRGFDMAMAEVGYRYTQLYWASQDRNWGYAAYQLRKIEKAVANGVERRPRRAASAQMLDRAVAEVRAAIEARDDAALDDSIETLTNTCNACHQAERVPFVHVAPPTVRSSPVGPPPAVEAQQGASAR